MPSSCLTAPTGNILVELTIVVAWISSITNGSSNASSVTSYVDPVPKLMKRKFHPSCNLTVNTWSSVSVFVT